MLRRLHPDRALEITLSGTATPLSRDYVDPRVGAEHLRALAAGRTDLLAQATGMILGGYLGQPGMSHPADRYATAILIMAGADRDDVLLHVDRTRGRVKKTV